MTGPTMQAIEITPAERDQIIALLTREINRKGGTKAAREYPGHIEWLVALRGKVAGDAVD